MEEATAAPENDPVVALPGGGLYPVPQASTSRPAVPPADRGDRTLDVHRAFPRSPGGIPTSEPPYRARARGHEVGGPEGNGHAKVRPVRERLEPLVGRLAFPFAITTAIAAAIFYLDRGAAPDTVTGLVILGSYVWVAILERLFPLHPQWQHDKGDLKADIGLGITNAVVNGVAQTLFIAAAVGVGAWASANYGAQIWPDHWPLVLQLIPALIIGEFVEYWFHRAWHEVPWLWPIHATHHSANRLYWFNALRFHPIDIVPIGPGKLVPLVILGADGGVLALVGVFSAVHGVYQHANLPCRIGVLNWIFSMAELHRWHHSTNVEEANHNYGGNLIFWDIVFGTRFLPKDREPPVDIGIGGLPNFPQDYLTLLSSPFRYRAIAAAAGPEGARARSSEGGNREGMN